ncbi:MAG: ABC transporter ATP-binding protein [Clostridia bacterium]|nr:ABC transporter ATP-binding protein [Clostridia bacterium]
MNMKSLKEISVYKSIVMMENTLFSVYTASYISELTNKAVNGISDTLWGSMILFLIALIIYISTQAIIKYFVSKREVQIKHKLKMSLYHDLFSLSPADLYRHRDTGEILETFRDDFNTAANLYCDVIPSVIISILSYFIYLGYVGTKNWKIMILIFVLSQLQLFVPLLIEPKFYDNYVEDREWEAKVTNVEIEAHTAFRDICIFRLYKWYEGYVEKFQKGAALVGEKYEYLCGFGTLFENLLKSVLQYGTYVIIGIGVFYSKLSIENAIVLLYLSGSIYTSLMETYDKITAFSENKASVERLASMSNHENEDSPVSLRVHDRLQISQCVVSAENQTILQTGSFEIRPDLIHIITGDNGTGKSTLLKVLAGYIIPNECTCSYKSDSAVSDLIYLPQEDMKLSESALDLVEPSEKNDFVRLCVNRFSLSEELLSQPLQTLSGGECKKIFLSYALIKSRECYLLLDEPSNHLDQTAKTVLASLIMERQGQIVVVTHDADLLSLLPSDQRTARIHVKKEATIS